MTGRRCSSSWMFLCIFLIKQCRLQEHSKRSSSMANKSNNFCFERSNRITVWAYLYPENGIAIQRQPSNVSACNWHSTGRIPVVAAAAEVSAVAQLAKLEPWALRLRPQQPLLPSLSTMSKRFFSAPETLTLHLYPWPFVSIKSTLSNDVEYPLGACADQVPGVLFWVFSNSASMQARLIRRSHHASH